jgi:N-acyl-D-aspartate/D-glutamate deacylase
VQCCKVNIGKVVDGCGSLWFWGDLAIQDGRIARIGLPETF